MGYTDSACVQGGQPCALPVSFLAIWLRGPDSNRRPSAYETDELPTALPHVKFLPGYLRPGGGHCCVPIRRGQLPRVPGNRSWCATDSRRCDQWFRNRATGAGIRDLPAPDSGACCQAPFSG